MAWIFIYFPEEDDNIFNVADKGGLENFCASVQRIVASASKSKKVKIVYDKDNVTKFLSAIESLDEKLAEDTESFIRAVFGVTSQEVKGNYESLKDFSVIYLIWNLSFFYDVDNKANCVRSASNLIAEAAEILFHYPAESILLLNICNVIPVDRSVLLVFKDKADLSSTKPQDPPLPDCFVHIPIASELTEIEGWISSFDSIGQLTISPNQIQELIGKGKVDKNFKRIDTPKILAEQLHVHFRDKDESALNIDGTWKHGKFDIPKEARDQLQTWGFKLPPS